MPIIDGTVPYLNEELAVAAFGEYTELVALGEEEVELDLNIQDNLVTDFSDGGIRIPSQLRVSVLRDSQALQRRRRGHDGTSLEGRAAGDFIGPG